MKECLIIGVDVSKATLDICFKPSDSCFQITNNKAGFKQLLSHLQKFLDEGFSVMVVMEHTGKYSLQLENFLRSKTIAFCKVAAIQIKRSMGLVRGKNDKIDASRIAEYGWLRRDILKADKPVPESIMALKELLSLRSKLVRDRSGYMNRSKELKAAKGASYVANVERKHKAIIGFLKTQIAALEAEIKKVIDSDQQLLKTVDLLRTIKGIGLIVAAYMICSTDNFTRFSDARKFNCYAGLAPFEHTSGTSIRARGRVSHMANKPMKTLLNLAAFCAIRCDGELKKYYQKRVAEGKRKMSCINIVRSKLVARMFAVIKRQTPFIPLEIAA